MRNRIKLLVISIMIFSLIVPIFSSMGTSQAAGSYLLKVNKGTNVVTVYRNGAAVKAFVCSTGVATPVGTFSSSQKYVWHELQGNVYGQYCTRITGSVLFHSVWYYAKYNKASQSYSAYNKLGTTASAGCVRLTVEDAKWIYDNCPSGTTVQVFYGNSGNDPLGKPTAIKVPNIAMGWDPTDPDPSNPYSAKKPTIEYRGSTEVEVHGGYDPRPHVVARDSAGNDISSRITVSGGLNTAILGSHNLTFTVTDSLGRSASTSVTIRVVDYKNPIISGVMKDRKLEYGKKLNIRTKVKAQAYAGASLTSKIKVRYKAPKTAEKLYKKSVITFKKLGVHKITYTVTNPQNGKTSRRVLKITVVDTKRPKLTNVSKSKKVEFGKRVNLRANVTATSTTGVKLNKYIVTSIRVPGSTKYKVYKNKMYGFNKLGKFYVKYTVRNPQNKKINTKMMIVTVVDTKMPNLSGLPANQKVEYGRTLDLVTGVKAVAVTGVNLKKNLIVSVKLPNGTAFKRLVGNKYKFDKLGAYTVKYDLRNPQNKRTRTASRTIRVVDTKAPIIGGVKPNQTIEYNSVLDMSVTAKSVAQENLTNKVEIGVKSPDNNEEKITLTTAKTYKFEQLGSYEFTYTVLNSGNKKTATKKVIITVVDSSELVINGIPETKETKTQNDTLDLLDGITASTVAGSVDLTSSISVSAKSPTDVEVTLTDSTITFSEVGTYQITYKVEHDGKLIEKTRTVEVL